MGGTLKARSPMSRTAARELRAGDIVYLSGTVYTARDAAHKRMSELLRSSGALPFDIEGQFIYYTGPAPAKPGHIIGPAGPTTSGRMDPFTPDLLRLGLRGTIGKGRRSPEVVAAMKDYGAVYLGTVGGTAALLSKFIRSWRIVAYPDLGPEAVLELVVQDFPAIVVIDSLGTDLYETEPVKYSCPH